MNVRLHEAEGSAPQEEERFISSPGATPSPQRPDHDMHVRDLAGDRGCPHPDRITPGSSVSSIAPIAFWSGYQILKSARGNEIAGFLVNFPRCRSRPEANPASIASLLLVSPARRPQQGSRARRELPGPPCFLWTQNGISAFTSLILVRAKRRQPVVGGCRCSSHRPRARSWRCIP